MNRKLLRRTRSRRGFTLIELGVVLAVTAILAAAILPDFIESARSRMAEKAAQDVAVIHDAARWFFIQTANVGGGVSGGKFRWPGEHNAGACDNDSTPVNAGMAQMQQMGFVTTNPMNPWGQDYDVEVKTPPGMGPLSTGMSPGCSFSVTTNVPDEVRDAFTSFLPFARCNDSTWCKAPRPGSSVPSHYSRCCSFVPKPGVALTLCPPPLYPTPQADGTLKCQ
ncbi:MAG TPA: prepilin-type N-terminal cleavage/methylation domain-containing protein [Myxococcales bacterium]|jgi:prepilin-type N-terminal cleavage/methylation domain-containing protein